MSRNVDEKKVEIFNSLFFHFNVLKFNISVEIVFKTNQPLLYFEKP